MAVTAIDASSSLAAHANVLAAAGIKRVGRYLSHNPSKNLTHSEALALGRAGIGCWMVWETTASRALSGATAGARDGRDAVAQAQDIGAPTGAGIYFAVDTDVTDADVAGPISDYFKAARDALGDLYVPGSYGPGAVCASVLDQGLIRLAWVWAARRTNGTPAFIDSDRWHLRQHVEIKPNTSADTLRIGLGYDPDDFKDSCGAFLVNDSGATLLGGDVPTPTPGVPQPRHLPLLTADSTGPAVSQVQDILQRHGFFNPTPGVMDPLTVEAVRALQKKFGLNVDGKVGEQETWPALLSLG
jgi:Rv2525c-like, glycoside hydrolase-like domain/Putative peptidoglycan binding domain